MLKIRLMRIGTKKRPFYRIVSVDERNKRTGGFIEILGTYNPLTEPKEIKLNQERIDYWVKQGAQMSVGFLRIIGKAPQRKPRKPKKPARKASQSDAGGESKQATGTSEQAKEEKQTDATKPVAEEAKVDEASQLSEAGEIRSESTSSDVHEPDRAGAEQSEAAELEKQNQPSDQSNATEKP